MGAGHVGFGPGLVDENQTVWIYIGLALEPFPTPLQDIRTILFRCVRRLFLRVMRCRRKKRCNVP
jgi:hypothetical protein